MAFGKNKRSFCWKKPPKRSVTKSSTAEREDVGWPEPALAVAVKISITYQPADFF
jgi:hypothetical protein